MTIEFNARRERIYAFIAILGFAATNAYFYFDDPFAIIELLSVQLLYVLMGGLYEGATLWMTIKFKQERMGALEAYWIILFLVIFNALLSNDLPSLSMRLLGSWTMTLTLCLGIVIVRQIYILRQPSEPHDSNNM